MNIYAPKVDGSEKGSLSERKSELFDDDVGPTASDFVTLTSSERAELSSTWPIFSKTTLVSSARVNDGNTVKR